MARCKPDQLFLGRGRDYGTAPRKEGGDHDGRGLARTLNAEEDDVVLVRRLEQSAAVPAENDAVAKHASGGSCPPKLWSLLGASPATRAVAVERRRAAQP